MLIHFLLTLSLLLPLYLRRIILLRYKQGRKIKGFSRFQLLSTRCSPAGRSVTCRIKQAVSGSCWGMTAHGQTDVQDHSRLVGEPVLQETTQKAIASIVKLTGNILWKKDQGLREEGEGHKMELLIKRADFSFVTGIAYCIMSFKTRERRLHVDNLHTQMFHDACITSKAFIFFSYPPTEKTCMHYQLNGNFVSL